jgi:DNA-binding NtrC family response regulator
MGAATQRVLVVEDDPSSRRALTLLLKLKGFEAIYAANLADAMRLIEEEPGSVLLDLMLPDGNGSTVLEHIRTNQLPIRVAITSGASNWQAMLGHGRLKPDAFFSKPLDFDRVVLWLNDAS